MRRKLPPGCTWCAETKQGRIDKRIGGQRFQRRFVAETEEAAISTYYRILGSREEGGTKPREERKFVEAAEKFLGDARNKSIERNIFALEKLLPWIGGLPLSAIHEGTLQPYIEHRKQQGVAANTVRIELATVRRILTLSSRVWRDSDNQPWLQTPPLLRMPQWGSPRKPYPLTWDEQTRFIKELPQDMAEMALFALNTGCRDQVVCKLRWDYEVQVPELETSVFLMPAETTKNGTEQLVVLNRVARSVIDRRRGIDKTWVFGLKGKPRHTIRSPSWVSAWARAGLPTTDGLAKGVHNLRHTFARRLRAAGVPWQSLKALMHHANGDITALYAVADIKELIDAVEKLCDTQPTTILRRAV
jgi:integrase